MKPQSESPLEKRSDDPANSAETDGSRMRLAIPGQTKTSLSLELESDADAEIAILKKDRDGNEIDSSLKRFTNLEKVSGSFFAKIKLKNIPWASVWMCLVLLIYLGSRFIHLDSFPIYFFSDEAIQTVQAQNLVQNDFHGEQNEFLPTYLINGGQYGLDVSIYIQIIPMLIFGKSIWVTRGLCVLFTLFAVISVGLIAKNIFKSPQPYLAMIILSITPAWFLHSRTAFETALAVSFYGAFIYCYLMYRQGQPKYLFAAAVFAALAFYSYSPAQMVVGVTFLALLLSDLRYHWQNRKRLLIAAGICLVLAVPYIRFLVNHPGENLHHLQILNSYLIKDIPTFQKITIYFQQYWQNLSPVYWFSPNAIDIVRHIMKGYGNLLWWSLPFVLLGLIMSIRHIKESRYRVLLIAVLAAPSGAALVGPGITRSLFMVIPAAVMAGIGVDQIIHWLERIHIKRAVAAGVCLAALIGVNSYMVYDVTVNAPTWFQDYSLSGMQYGARQLYTETVDYMKANPKTKLIISSQWANGSDILARFFISDPMPYSMGSIEMWLDKQLPLDNNYTFVVIPEEMERIQSNPKFKMLQILKTIPYPNGKPGFYFVIAAYADNISQIFADEATVRHQLISGTVLLADGTTVNIDYPALDMGKIQDAFDGNQDTLIRSSEANPLILKLDFPDPHPLSEITLRIGGNPTTMKILVTPADGSPVIELDKVVPVYTDYRNITFSLDKEIAVSKITISVENTENEEPAHVHLWEVMIK